jgi:hypothetical protein
MVAPAASGETEVPARPTFTARPGGQADAVPEPALAPDDVTEPERTVPTVPAPGPDYGADDGADIGSAGPVPAAGPLPFSDPVRAEGSMSAEGSMPADGSMPAYGPAPTYGEPVQARPQAGPADLDEPLLSDVTGLHARWQRVQAGFVDDPQEAVGEAADLIEQTAQAMVGALRQRQRQLRVLWAGGPADGPTDGLAAADGESASHGADTERLRQLMREYRALFNQLCRP